MKHGFFAILQLMAAVAAADAQAAGTPPDPAVLIAEAERIMYPNAKVSATLSFNDGKGRTDAYGMTFYTRDRNQRIIVRFTSPASHVGNDILMIDQNVWSFDNRSKRVMKVPSNQSFGGTGFSYGDVVRLNFSDNYAATLVGQTDSAWKLSLSAKDRNAPYFRIELHIDKIGGWPVQGTCFAKSGAVVKTIHYGAVGDAGAGRKPLTLTVLSPSNPGESNVMTVSREELKELPERVFNKRNLETRLEENL